MKEIGIIILYIKKDYKKFLPKCGRYTCGTKILQCINTIIDSSVISSCGNTVVSLSPELIN